MDEEENFGTISYLLLPKDSSPGKVKRRKPVKKLPKEKNKKKMHEMHVPQKILRDDHEVIDEEELELENLVFGANENLDEEENASNIKLLQLPEVSSPDKVKKRISMKKLRKEKNKKDVYKLQALQKTLQEDQALDKEQFELGNHDKISEEVKKKSIKNLPKEKRKKKVYKLQALQKTLQEDKVLDKELELGNHDKISGTVNKRISIKTLRREKNKEELYKFQALQNMLQEEQICDKEELELGNRVFGGDIVHETDLSPSKKKRKKSETNQTLKEEDSADNISDSEHQETKKPPAWEDEDDDNILVKEKAETLRKCHRSVSLRGDEKYSKYVQEKFVKLVGAPKWADLEKDNYSDASDDQSEEEPLLQTTGTYIKPSISLPKGSIGIRKCRSLEDENSKGAIITSVEFHPSSRVALVAGLNCTATLYQIDGKENSKMQSVHFEKFPIHTAHFSVDGMQIVAGSRYFGHYFIYDMVCGKIMRVSYEKAMEQSNVRRFHMSPDGKYIVIHGKYGNIHLVSAKSKEYITSLKMNGEVGSIAFTKDSSKMYSNADSGEVYVWDMSSRRCMHKFTDEGCVAGTSLALSPNGQYLATGSDSGVVNIYDASKVLTSTNPTPAKTLFNLTTEVNSLKFNCTSELLAMASSHKANALKLVHFPSMTVFSNFPTRERNMQYLNCVDISLNSGFLSVGNNRGSAFVHRLQHYTNY